MAIVKTLDILLRGKTAELSKDLKKSEGLFKSWGGRVSSIVLAALPVISVAGLTAGIRSALTELDGLAKRSVRLSIDAGELASLERASSLAGLGIGQLTNAQKVLSVQTIKAIEGGREQVRIFEQLGISAKKFSQLTPTQQLIEFGKALDGVEGRAEKTRIAVGLFGKAGLSILPLVANGAEDLKKSFAETARLGGIFQAGDLKKVEEFNDRISDLKFTISNLFKSITIQLAPGLTAIAKSLIEAVKPGTLFSGIFRGIGEVARSVLVPLQLLASTFSAISNFLGTSTGQLIGYIAATAVIIKLTQQFLVVLKATRAILASILAIKAATAALDKTIIVKAGFAAGVFTAVVASVAALENQIEGVFKQTQQAAAEMGKFENAAERSSKMQLNIGSASAGSQAAFETVYAVKVQAPMNLLISATQEGNDILGEIRDKIGEAGSIVEESDILGDLG